MFLKVVQAGLRCFTVLAMVIPLLSLAYEDELPKQRDCGDDCVAVGDWQFNLGVGIGLRTNPLVDESDTPLILLPELSYYGKRFFFKNFDFGYTLFEDSKHQLNALMLPSRDQMYFNRWDPLNIFDPSGSGGFSGAPPVTGSSPDSNDDYERYNIRASYLSSGGQSSSLVGNPPESQSSSDGATGSFQGGSASSEGVPDTPTDSSSQPTNAGGGVTSSASSMPANLSIEFNGLTELSVNGEDINPELIASGGRVQIGSTFVTMSSDSLILETVDGTPVDLIIAAAEVSLRNNGSEFQDVGSGDLSSETVELEVGSIEITSRNNSFFQELTDKENGRNEGDPGGNGGTGNPAPNDGAPPALNLNGLRDRRVALLSGLEYSYSTDQFILHLQALRDISNAHDGTEFRLAAIIPMELSSSRLAFTYGLNFQDSEVLSYYYGLNADDHVDPYYYYRPGGGLSQMFRLDWQKPISRRWALRAMIQVTQLAEEIADSPLVEEDSVRTMFFGGVYYF